MLWGLAGSHGGITIRYGAEQILQLSANTQLVQIETVGYTFYHYWYRHIYLFIKKHETYFLSYF